jgi:hypothetical protein
MSKEKVNKKDSIKDMQEMELTIERILEINDGIRCILDNKDIPNRQSVKIGLFKIDIDKVCKVHDENVSRINIKYAKMRIKDPVTKQKILPLSVQEALKKERDDMLKEKQTLRVRTFKVSDFDEIEVPPLFYYNMKELIVDAEEVK